LREAAFLDAEVAALEAGLLAAVFLAAPLAAVEELAFVEVFLALADLGADFFAAIMRLP
jgi:hypothetical protein